MGQKVYEAGVRRAIHGSGEVAGDYPMDDDFYKARGRSHPSSALSEQSHSLYHGLSALHNWAPLTP